MAKGVKWSRDHTDKYVYNADEERWEKVACNLSDMDCTAPKYIPRGEMPSNAYNTSLTSREEYYLPELLGHY